MGNTRAVSPIIATVLLLMMTVAVAGAAYFWFSNVQGSIQSSLQKRVGQTVQQASQSIRIAYSDCYFIGENDTINVSMIVQNTGTQKIDGKFLVVVQEEDQDLASNTTDEMTINPNTYSEEFYLTFLDGGHEIANEECGTRFSFEASISEVSDSTSVNCTCND